MIFMELCGRRAGHAHSWPSPRRPFPAKTARCYASWFVRGQLPKLAWDDPKMADFLVRRQPVILSDGCPLCSELVHRWSFEYLASAFGSFDRLPVHFVPSTGEAFTRHYGGGIAEGGIHPMSFRAFSEAVSARCRQGDDTSLDFYLQTPLLWQNEGDPPDALLQELPISDQLREDLMYRIAHKWLLGLLAQGGLGRFQILQFWAGHGCGHSPCHYDDYDNFLCQLSGCKRVLIFSPQDSFRLCPYPYIHPMHRHSMADLKQPNLARHPTLAQAHGLEAILQPGDVLWLPQGWWHVVQQLGPNVPNMSLSFWCGSRTTFGETALEGQLRPAGSVVVGEETHHAESLLQTGKEESVFGDDNGAALRFLQASRWLERLATQWFGGVHAGKFIHAIATRADAAWPSDSQAYRNAQRFRKELGRLASWLDGSVCTVEVLLRLMIRDGRLFPGLARTIEGSLVSADRGDFSL
mmetsp:Transcript_61365/g.102136  ORF Transcript_61365/g.102136 Transcript_61365/m.102136 type:complete len:466 (-) Transcript_61365:114-1511(-)